eukprot:6004772-Alexandrium_andersonii.AAC.1
MAAQIASDLKEGADAKDSRAVGVGRQACGLLALRRSVRLSGAWVGSSCTGLAARTRSRTHL